MSRSRTAHLLTRAGIVTVAAMVALALLAVPASAHATLEATSPEDGEAVEGGPDEIVLTFSEEMAQPAMIAVTDPNGDMLPEQEADVDAERVILELDSLTVDGAYHVEWRAVSADDHPVDGEFTFQATGAEDTPADHAEQDADDAGDEDQAADDHQPDADAPADNADTDGEGDGDADQALAAGEPAVDDGLPGPPVVLVIGIGVLLAGAGIAGAMLARRRQIQATQAPPSREA